MPHRCRILNRSPYMHLSSAAAITDLGITLEFCGIKKTDNCSDRAEWSMIPRSGWLRIRYMSFETILAGNMQS